MTHLPSTLPLGVALLSAGLVGIVVRYGLFPLQLGLSMLWKSIIVGTLAALLVVGWRTVSQARKAGETVHLARELVAALGAAIIVGGIGLLLARSGGPHYGSER